MGSQMKSKLSLSARLNGVEPLKVGSKWNSRRQTGLGHIWIRQYNHMSCKEILNTKESLETVNIL